MGKITKQHKHNAIKQKRRRHEKIQKLSERFISADSKEREHILTKIRKVAPAYPLGGLGQGKR
jgi:hypothetical protein